LKCVGARSQFQDCTLVLGGNRPVGERAVGGVALADGVEEIHTLPFAENKEQRTENKRAWR